MIIIDAGHGGWDPGGGSNNIFKEKDINKLISDYQKRRFDDLGIPSVLTRPTDETLNPRERINRIRSFNPKEQDILISNHVNTGKSSGGEVIYSKKTSKELPNLIGSNLKEVGLPIRNVYQKIGSNGNDFYFILRQTKPNTSMIIEYGFASDESDVKRILSSWPTLAEAVVKSIADYLNVPYTPPKETTYIVKTNDSLYKIAKKFNTTIQDIKTLNNLKSDVIYPNSILLIPKTSN